MSWPPSMRIGITADQLMKLIAFIQENHSFENWRNPGSRHIKYIRPHYDTRFKDVYRISLDYYTFDYRDNEKNLYDRVMAWLNGSTDPENQPGTTTL